MSGQEELITPRVAPPVNSSENPVKIQGIQKKSRVPDFYRIGQRGGTLENSGEMLGWELRELRSRVTKKWHIKKFTDEKSNLEKKPQQKRTLQK